MTSKFWKYILAFFVLFSGALGLVFVTLLPSKVKNAENHYTQTNNGALSGKNGQVVGVLNNPQLKQDVEENPGLKMVFDSLSSYKAIADKLVVSEDAITPKNEEKNIAENLFPKKYLNSLYAIQDGFVTAGWIQESEKTTFDSEKNVLDFLKTGVEIFIKQGVYKNPQDIERARTAVNVIFPQLWAAERDSYRQRASLPWNFQKNKSQETFYASKKQSILDGFLSAIIPPTQFAEAVGADGRDDFVTIPDCWKSKIPQIGTGGTNLYAFCCNCGLFCSYGCTFYWDCGEHSSSCNVPLGCLNQVCGPADAYNAIFDGPPGYEVPATTGYSAGFNFQYSFTCGCDAY